MHYDYITHILNKVQNKLLRVRTFPVNKFCSNELNGSVPQGVTIKSQLAFLRTTKLFNVLRISVGMTCRCEVRPYTTAVMHCPLLFTYSLGRKRSANWQIEPPFDKVVHWRIKAV